MNNRKNVPLLYIILVFLCIRFPVFGQESQVNFNTAGIVDWVRGELKATAGYNLAEAGLRLPTGRFMGEEILKEAYPRLLRPYLLSLRVDSNSTVKTLLDRGELSLEELDGISRNADAIPPALSADLGTIHGAYTVFLDKISAFLWRHKMIDPGNSAGTRQNQASPLAIPLRPIPTADYTGIIIIADKELPIRGRMTQALAEPCLFPKIWDTEMNIIYDRNNFTPGLWNSGRDGPSVNMMVRYTVMDEIFKPTPSGLDGELAALAGPYPLRILTREIFGISPTDLVIDREDALKILSNENNRRLLYEGRVVIVLSNEMLTPR